MSKGSGWLDHLVVRLDPLGRPLMPVAWCPGSLVEQQKQPHIVAALPNRVPANHHTMGGEEL